MNRSHLVFYFTLLLLSFFLNVQLSSLSFSGEQYLHKFFSKGISMNSAYVSRHYRTFSESLGPYRVLLKPLTTNSYPDSGPNVILISLHKNLYTMLR